MAKIKTISELLNYKFIIPNYQRGYRWGKQEIEELLSDLFEYAKSNEIDEIKRSKFYCLQPIVVIQKNDEYELVDGQQRLTTIYLILKYLKDVGKIGDGINIYSLKYQIRDASADFLEKESYKDGASSNIDFYYISEAYKVIGKWFDDPKNNDAKEKIKDLLVGDSQDKKVSVIWYQISREENGIDLFTRLNQGKIPLTDAELIKALLLQSDRYPTDKKELYDQKLFEIASEWDEIEKKLNDERFWYFLTEDSNDFSSKIELIYKILAEKWNKKENLGVDDKCKHFIYIVFDQHLKNMRKNKNEDYDIAEVKDIWYEVTTIFNQFYYWYTNHTLYHYIGYLIAVSKFSLSDLFELSQRLGKREFENELKSKIGEAVKITKKLEDISYNEDNDSLIKILLLFNVDAMVKNESENSRFPFNLYKKQKITSLEHIHPQNPESLDTKEERAKKWLEQQMGALKNYKELKPENYKKLQPDRKEEIDDDIDVIEKIDNLLRNIDNFLQNYEKDKFSEVAEEIIKLSLDISGFNEKQKHTLYNLALVDKDTNSSLNNSFFDVKRDILKNKTKNYVPICTLRAFEKYYSESPKEMIFWSEKDREAYFSAIKEVYNKYCSFAK